MDIEWLGFDDERLQQYGLARDANAPVLCRMEKDILPSMSERVRHLSYCLSGARIRFRTNSNCIILDAAIREDTGKLFVDRGGISGFDLYVNKGGETDVS